MDHISFYNEQNPMLARDRGCCSFEPSQRIKIRNITIIATGIIALALSAFYIYDGVTSLVSKSIKPVDQAFKIAELLIAGIVFLGTCELGAYGASLSRNYQETKESYPHNEAYQGSITGDLLEFVSSPHSDQFSEMIWEPFLSDFLDQFEPVLLDRYCLLKNITIEDRIEHFRKELDRGCCLGYSIALLAKMKHNSKLTSSELKDSVKIETAVYFQLVYGILHALNQSKLSIYPLFYLYYKKDHSSISFKQFLDAAEFVHDILEDDSVAVIHGLLNRININRLMDKYALNCDDASSLVKPARLIFNYCGLLSNGMLFHESDYVENFETKEKNALSELLNGASEDILSKNNGNQLVLTGYVSMQLTNSLDKLSGHAFFFQCGDGYFRFTDSGSMLKHFFEFDTQESMIAGLEAHVKKVYKNYKKIALNLILVGIPKEEPIFIQS